MKRGVSDNDRIFKSPFFYFIFKSTIISFSITKFFINSSIILIFTFLCFFSCFIKFRIVFSTLTVVCLCIFLMLCVIVYWVNSSFALFVPRVFIPLKFLDSNNVPNCLLHLNLFQNKFFDPIRSNKFF